MEYLFLAEKPSTMNAVKNAYNNSSKPLGNIDFFALAGHICKLCEPKDYEAWNVKWNERDLPMIPNNFKVGVLTANKVKELKEKLKSKHYDAIIVGTDSDVEGNGIYDLIEQYLHLENYKTYRFFETDLTPKGIMQSMNDLKDYHTNPRDVGMTQAFRIRSRFDWLIGFNMTVAYTVKSGFLMKVGRVKAPTLKLVYDNCAAIDGFSSKESYQPLIKTNNPDLSASMIDEAGKPVVFQDIEKAKAECNNISNNVKVASYENNIKKTQPDQLYKLTDIQYDAGMKYGYSPEKTLELIQSLYETHKLISYPRTDGRYVSSEKSKDFPRLLNAVKSMKELSDIANSITTNDINLVQNNKRYVNDKEVQKTSHDALIPTGEIGDLSKLNKDEYNICEMIYRRFLSIFLPPLEEEKTKAVLQDADGRLFSCTGSKVLNKGYTILYKIPEDNILPILKNGDVLNVVVKEYKKIVTKPPARFSQASLIKAMENVQKYMTTGELKDAMKKAGGIGQPSSRAAIISELISSGYMEEKKSGKSKGLYITDSGKTYIENLGNSSIVSPELSAEWEVHMSDIREGKSNYEEIYGLVVDYVKTALNELNNMDIHKINSIHKEIGVCPKCGKPVIEYKKAYLCSEYKRTCDFGISKEIAGKNVTEKNAKDLLEGNATDIINGFKSKSGKIFSAALKLTDEGKLEWVFDVETDFKCPNCGKSLIKTPKSYKCSDESCGFTLWTNICGKNLTESQIKNLLTGKATGVIKGMKKKNGESFNASLIIKDGKLTWANTRKDIGVKCPNCGKPIFESDNGYYCNDCKQFHLPKVMCKSELTKKDIKDLIEKNETSVKNDFIGKSGNSFSAKLILKDDFSLGFVFEQKNKK